MNDNSTIQHSSCRNWSLIVKICRDNAVQDLTLVSMVKSPVPSKGGRKGRTFVGEYLVVDDATRIGCQQNLGSFHLLAFDNRYLRFTAGQYRVDLNNFNLALCNVAMKASS